MTTFAHSAVNIVDLITHVCIKLGAHSAVNIVDLITHVCIKLGAHSAVNIVDLITHVCVKLGDVYGAENSMQLVAKTC